MIQVWLIDENNFFTGESKFVEEIADGMTTEPYLIGYIKGKLVDCKWVEGATQQEIAEWEEANKPKPSEPTDSDKISILAGQLEELSEYTLALEMKSLELEDTTGMNSEYVLHLDERLTNIELKN